MHQAKICNGHTSSLYDSSSVIDTVVWAITFQRCTNEEVVRWRNEARRIIVQIMWPSVLTLHHPVCLLRRGLHSAFPPTTHYSTSNCALNVLIPIHFQKFRHRKHVRTGILAFLVTVQHLYAHTFSGRKRSNLCPHWIFFGPRALRSTTTFRWWPFQQTGYCWTPIP